MFCLKVTIPVSIYFFNDLIMFLSNSNKMIYSVLFGSKYFLEYMAVAGCCIKTQNCYYWYTIFFPENSPILISEFLIMKVLLHMY